MTLVSGTSFTANPSEKARRIQRCGEGPFFFPSLFAFTPWRQVETHTTTWPLASLAPLGGIWEPWGMADYLTQGTSAQSHRGPLPRAQLARVVHSRTLS